MIKIHTYRFSHWVWIFGCVAFFSINAALCQPFFEENLKKRSVKGLYMTDMRTMFILWSFFYIK